MYASLNIAQGSFQADQAAFVAALDKAHARFAKVLRHIVEKSEWVRGAECAHGFNQLDPSGGLRMLQLHKERAQT